MAKLCSVLLQNASHTSPNAPSQQNRIHRQQRILQQKRAGEHFLINTVDLHTLRMKNSTNWGTMTLSRRQRWQQQPWPSLRIILRSHDWISHTWRTSSSCSRDDSRRTSVISLSRRIFRNFLIVGRRWRDDNIMRGSIEIECFYQKKETSPSLCNEMGVDLAST